MKQTKQEVIQEIELMGLGSKVNFKYSNGANKKGQLIRNENGFAFLMDNGAKFESDSIQSIKNHLIMLANESHMNIVKFEIQF